MIPERLQIPLAALLVIAVILIGTFASPQSSENDFQNRGISIAGLVVFYVVLYATSANRKMIVWRTVLVGLLCQYVLALFVLRTGVGYDIFNFISFLARYFKINELTNKRELLSFANAGTSFLTDPSIPNLGILFFNFIINFRMVPRFSYPGYHLLYFNCPTFVLLGNSAMGRCKVRQILLLGYESIWC